MFNYTYDKDGVYIANLANKGEKYGLTQYRLPHNYELQSVPLRSPTAGKSISSPLRTSARPLSTGGSASTNRSSSRSGRILCALATMPPSSICSRTW